MKQLIVIGIIVFLFIAFFPQIASTSAGKRFFLEAIQSKTHTTVTAKKLHLSWLGPQQFSDLAFKSKELNGSIENLRVGVHFWSMLSLFQLKNIHEINGDVSFENGSFEFQSSEVETVQLTSMNGSLHLYKNTANFTANGTAKQNTLSGSFAIIGQLQELNQKNPDFSIQGDFIHFPTLPVARILSSQEIVDENIFLQTLGNTFDLKGSASHRENQGLLDLTLHSPNLDTEIHGDIIEHQLTLRQPLTATFQLTPELSRWILRDINPLFVSGIQAKTPILLRIEPSNFQCPLDSLRIENIQIGQGTLDMGQIRCKNVGSLASLTTLLKNSSLSNEEITLWFTPLSFHLQHGRLKTQRLDALIANSIHICTWGTIDLTNDQLDMFLGIPADTLKKTFGISNLSEDFVLKIPLTGTTKKPSLATKAAAAKIAALLASEKTPHHWLHEGIMSIFTQTDRDVPPPHRPFPWE